MEALSDAATDARYEAGLRACDAEGHGTHLFFFKVNGAQVAVCARCSIRLIEDVTAGDGSEWDQQVRQAREEFERTVERHPAGSASGTLKCCQPRMLATPSGRIFAHSRFCSESPGERVKISVYSQGRTGTPWAGRRLRG